MSAIVFAMAFGSRRNKYMGNCFRRRDELQSTAPYVDKHIHSEHKIGFDLSVHKSDKKMGVETVCTGKVTHDREETYEQKEMTVNKDECEE